MGSTWIGRVTREITDWRGRGGMMESGMFARSGRLWGQAQDITHAAPGLDQCRFFHVDLASKVRDVGLDDAGLTAEVVVPHMVEDLGLGPVSYTHLRAHETGRNLVC